VKVIESTLLILAPLILCATTIERECLEGNPCSVGPRYELEVYNHSLPWLCDIQIEEIASFLPPLEAEALRNEHYAWKLQRDVDCAEADRNASGPLGGIG